LKIIGITGASGAGKTTVCNIIEKEYNAKIIDADKIAKKLSEPGTEYYNEIIKYFGLEILQTVGGEFHLAPLDRKKLADIIFYDDSKRKILNKLTGKYVVKEIIEEIEKHSKTEEIIVLDAPLLFEFDLDKKCNQTIGVIADENLKINRICKRDGINESLAKQRINSLKKDEFFIQNCTNIIKNDGDIERVKEQIHLILN